MLGLPRRSVSLFLVVVWVSVEKPVSWVWAPLAPSLEWVLSLEVVALECAPSWASVCNEQDGMLCYTERNSLDTSPYSLDSILTDE